MEGEPASGETVLVQDARGQSLALAAFSPESQIRGRVWAWDVNQTIDEGFFRRRLESAIHMRRSLGLERPGAAVRLVHGLPPVDPPALAGMEGSGMVRN